MFNKPACFSILKGTDCKQFLTASPISFPSTKVPVLTLGIKPFGPRILATFITVGNIEIVAKHLLKAGKVPSIKAGTNSSPPTILAPASEADLDCSAEAKTRIDGREFNNSGFGKFKTPLNPFDLIETKIKRISVKY